ncbi:hypothetical protein B7494_g6580 [Chlorociboria aeruginascens]|nr:hypothetical protein B7494_g6580 [Chlorociboria aeruginascens]
MGPIDKKRKNGPTNESFARSRKADNAEERPSKRPRPGEVEDKTTTGLKVPLVPKISRAGEEEAAFPRGGASVLTPLEHKQIQIEATRDVLFEQQNSKGGADEEGIRTVKKSKSRGKNKKESDRIQDEEETVKIEGLSFKRIIPGSLVLGLVSEINDHDIALSLPNNLTGYVPITSISDKLTQRIEAIAAAEDRATDEESELDDIDLNSLFSIGQYLRAFVVSTSDDAKSTTFGKAKRRIELSLRPQQSNNALTAQNVITYNTIMASVVSVEDHGVIMDLGLDDQQMRGFMSSKEIGHGIELSSIQEGAVYLCIVTGLNSNGKTVKLSTDCLRMGNSKKPNHLSEAPTIDAFLPGTVVEILVADITSKGISGKVMGMLDVTADLMHSGAGASGRDLEKKYKVGSKVKGRVICTFPTSDPPKLGVSLLDHVLSLVPQQAIKNGQKEKPLDILPLSTIIEEATVGSTHRARIIGYNFLDGVYLVSLEQSILEQPFLRIEDLRVGEIVKGKVETIIVNATGVGGVLINLSEGISGLAPEMHLADVQLLHPEKKFREGMTVTARVLSTDPSKRQIRLTLKKSLVNSEAAPFINYKDISVGMQSPGTIVNILPTGAVVQFYGTIRGFLPVAEMSEAFIQDPTQHFRVGQVVSVHVLKVDSEANKLIVSCKDPSAFGLAQQAAMKKLKIGEIVSAVVTEKSNDDISVEIQRLGLRAILPVGHLTDGTQNKNLSALKKIRVGQTLTDLVVLEKLEQKRLIILTSKPSLLKDAKSRTLLRSFEDVKENKAIHGFIRNITPTAVFVQFAGGLTGLLPKSKLPEDAVTLPEFGLRKFQTVEVRVISVDQTQQRFTLSMTDLITNELPQPVLALAGDPQEAINPVDDRITSVDDLTLGKLTKARVVSVKETQINVKLADNIQGRIDISQIFDSWEDIKDPKRPLKNFSQKQVISVRVLGIHDARNHKFLPISHRGGKTLVFELSAKPSDQTESAQEPLMLDKVKIGSSYIVFVNNIRVDCLWVNLSPNVRGRIRALDISDDVSLLNDLDNNFPIGSAISVHVKAVDVANNRLDLSGRSTGTSETLTFQNLSNNMVVPGKITKVTERQIMVQLSEDISGPVYLPDFADDFSEAIPTKYSKNDIVRVCVTEIDVPNKRMRLSTRPSRVLNSSLTVQDPEISSIFQLKVNDIVRGFVKNVSDKGLFINLGGNVIAYVRVSDLSDSYIKDWKSEYEVGQLIKGKVTELDTNLNHVQMSLKTSVIDKNYVAPIVFNDIKVGQIITGKIRKVEDFGVFIVVDGSSNVSGLCHQSEMAEKRVHDVKKLYEEGDAVKAVVLKVDAEKKRISFGMNASYFEDSVDSDNDSDDDDSVSDMPGVKLGTIIDEDSEEEDNNSDGGINLDGIENIEINAGLDEQSSDMEMKDIGGDDSIAALNAGGFDWSAGILNNIDDQSSAGSSYEDTAEKPKKKKRRKAEIQVDRTGDLDLNGPQSVSDFERLLLGQSDSSQLWIEYMAFQMQLSELSKAREVAERAIKMINIREETEKMNVWIALLNLENTYGSDETVNDAFKRACQYNDAQEIHERLTSIYIQSGKHNKADDLFQTLVKKFSQSPTVWYNYAHFLHTTLSSPDRARALLPRATQSLPSHTHLALTLKFAALEFHSASGSPERGRTMFEGLLATFPKRLDIWNQLLDLEVQQGDVDVIRGVFERVVKIKGIKPKGVKAWFRRWSEWEAKNGDKKTQEKVKAKAEEWVRSAAKSSGGGEL